jgi:DNA-binding ferritin-like protein
MAKTQTRKNRKSSSTISPIKNIKKIKSSKSVSSVNESKFQKEISTIFLEILLMVKLYHWKTTSYAVHKATDEFYTKLNENMDSFIEMLLGKTQNKKDLGTQKEIRILDHSNLEIFIKNMETFKYYLLSLDNNSFMVSTDSKDLFNIRDTIWGDVNQLLYLLSFK